MDDKERLRLAKEALGSGSYDKETIEYIFPELKESEDDRIKEDIISYIQLANQFIPQFQKDKWIAWLEKQDSYYTFEIKKGHWYKCVCDYYMLNGSDLLFKNGRLYYCRSDWRLKGEIDVRNVKRIGVNGYKSFFRPATNQEIKDWLEKQGEQKPIDFDTLIQQRLDALADIVADQKPTNKVEPKFKVGDWTVSNLDRKARQISEVHFDEYNSYYVIDGKSVNLEEYDRLHHLWTIQDAKDGDVLAADNGLAFIYNGYLEEQQWPFAYGGINIYGRFNICDGLLPFTHQKVVPATKEQRDILFQKMKEAGYEWDNNKKGLRKIEQKPTWSEEDEKIALSIEQVMNCASLLNIVPEKIDKIRTWLKSLKDRVQPKQEWSEEDERTYKSVLYAFEHNYPLNNEQQKFIKSLKPHNTWKPSDEH